MSAPPPPPTCLVFEEPPQLGGKTDKYSWTQTLQDVSVCIPVPPGTTSKMLAIKIQTKSIEVGIKGGKTLVGGALHSTVLPDECFWTLDKGCVEITLNKVALQCVCFRIFALTPCAGESHGQVEVRDCGRRMHRLHVRASRRRRS